MERAKIRYKVGVEIETNLYPCDLCSECAICDNCPTCEYCVNGQYYCNRCNIDEVIEYLIDNSIIDDVEEIKTDDGEIDTDKVCELCQEHEVWRGVICEYCNPCDSCEYYRNLNYCPHDTFEPEDFISNDEVIECLDRCYYDCSCGMEFPTIPFDSIKDLHEFLKKFANEVGTSALAVDEKCGGHTNISLTDYVDELGYFDESVANRILHNLIYVQDLISYMFLNYGTSIRSDYKYPIKKIEDSDDKYTFIHRKYYAIEIRGLDTPNNPDNHVLATAFALAIAMIPYRLYYTDDDVNMTYEIAKTINFYDGFDDVRNNKTYMNYMKDKLKSILKLIKPYLQQLSHEIGYDLEKALLDRFNNPQYLKPNWTLEPFKLKKSIVKTVDTDYIQTTITQFIIETEIAKLCESFNS